MMIQAWWRGCSVRKKPKAITEVSGKNKVRLRSGKRKVKSVAHGYKNVQTIAYNTNMKETVNIM